jgi:hypothetical protein
MSRGTQASTAAREAAAHLMEQIRSVVTELNQLRKENELLRRDLARRNPRHNVPRPSSPERKTRHEVDGEVVLAVLRRLGPSTAAEIAAEITRAGVPVKGQAVRFLAERAGARVRVDRQGQRRYYPSTADSGRRRPVSR